MVCLFVCFITKSFLTYPFLHLHMLYQSYVGLCQATCVQSHPTQPRSAIAIALDGLARYTIYLIGYQNVDSALKFSRRYRQGDSQIPKP